MNNLFTYGTLMCKEIFYSVTGLAAQGRSALLNNYSRHPVAGEVYPGIVKCEGSSVKGIVYFDIPEILWTRLDLFEGPMYRRQIVYVQCRGQENLPAHAYVVLPQYAASLTIDEWDYHKFLSAGKKKFLEGYPGYASIIGDSLS